jgi:hypothetical protein
MSEMGGVRDLKEAVSELEAILDDARAWLVGQETPADGSAAWYGFNNLRTFLDQIEADRTADGLERACHALGWHISDQYGAYEELSVIAAFNDRVRQIARKFRWARSGSPPSAEPSAQ